MLNESEKSSLTIGFSPFLQRLTAISFGFIAFLAVICPAPLSWRILVLIGVIAAYGFCVRKLALQEGWVLSLRGESLRLNQGWTPGNLRIGYASSKLLIFIISCKGRPGRVFIIGSDGVSSAEGYRYLMVHRAKLLVKTL